MPVFTFKAARSNLAELIARAEAGEEIILARGRKAVAKIIPFQRGRNANSAV